MNRKIFPGKPFPLGATWDGKGVNFALYSENADAVELCLFDAEGNETRHRIREMVAHVWHGYIAGIQPGQQYGYRIHGPFDPQHGHRFNPHKLLIDPYAKAISGRVTWHDSLFAYELGHADSDLSFSPTDSADFIPKSIVIDHHFDWEDDKSPAVPYRNTIIYETHIKGFSMLHPEIPEHLRGTYLALAHPVSINYMKSLGITSVELMPVHHFITERHLADKGLTNYWGYNTIGYFAPDVRYATSANGEQVNEFKQMVKELHKAGIEVILDVVYNHTAEGNELGPTLSFRGIDNKSYYRLTDDQRYYMDYTGCGNTLNANMPNVLRLIMDSLRYWILEMHIDGFRFDLASTLARELHDVDRLSAFFDIIHQDPVISQTKLIAEPWDVGEGGYQVGKFPPGWAEWNGLFRDCMRDYWRGADGMLSEFAERFTGSSDLYKNDFRRPTASINFITAHDGFTLHDLVSYHEKHNEDNGEENNDGDNHNRSANYGCEGETDDPLVLTIRHRQKRNFLVTLFLSQGIPMLVAGDELGRTQKGNNNAYCQDNEMSWINWDKADALLIDFTRDLVSFYRKHPAFRRNRWFKGTVIRGTHLKDIAWFGPDAEHMTIDNWHNDAGKSLAVYLNGKGIRTKDENGKTITDDHFYIMFNAHPDDLHFALPPEEYGDNWQKVIDTAEGIVCDGLGKFGPRDNVVVPGRSVLVFKQRSHV